MRQQYRLFLFLFRDHLESQGIVVKLTGTNEFDAKEDFLNFVEKENITVAVGLHALHAGKCLRHLGNATKLSNSVLLTLL